MRTVFVRSLASDGIWYQLWTSLLLPQSQTLFGVSLPLQTLPPEQVCCVPYYPTLLPSPSATQSLQEEDNANNMNSSS